MTTNANGSGHDRIESSTRVQAQAAKAMLAVDRRLGRPSDPRLVELAKRAR